MSSTVDANALLFKPPAGLPLSGQWCTQCKLNCRLDENKIQRCAVNEEYARIKKEDPPNWLEISRVCSKPVLPSWGKFTINARETEPCDVLSNISHFPRNNCIDENKPTSEFGLQPNCWVTEEVVVQKYASLTIKGIKNPHGRRPIVSGHRQSRIFYGMQQSKMVRNFSLFWTIVFILLTDI